MSVHALTQYDCSNDYNEISMIANKINAEITIFNIKVAVKVAVLACVFFALAVLSGGVLAAYLVIMTGGQIEIGGLMLALLVMSGELGLMVWAALHQIYKLQDSIHLYPNEINDKMQGQLNKFSPEIIKAFQIKKSYYRKLFVTHIELDPLERVKERCPANLISNSERLPPKSKTDSDYWESHFRSFFNNYFE